MHENFEISTILKFVTAAFLMMSWITGLRLTYAAAEDYIMLAKEKKVYSYIEITEQVEEQMRSKVKDIKPAKLLRKVSPPYPQEAKDAGITGVVILEATTNIYGHVEKVKVLRSIAELDQAAIDAIKEWVYEPIVIEGEPKEVIFTVSFWFSPDIKRSDITFVGGVTGLDKSPPVRLIGDIEIPKTIKRIEPKYPQDAKDTGIEGVVIVEITTNIKGRVQGVKILRSIPELDQLHLKL